MSGTDSLGFAIGKIYVEGYFSGGAKKQMTELAENLRTVLGQRIGNLDWMGEETKESAPKKLAAVNPNIGHSDAWISFDGLTISDKDLVDNIENILQFFQNKDVEKGRQKTDCNSGILLPGLHCEKVSPAK